MPIYTYICTNCKTQFDLLVGVCSEKPELKCVKCGSGNITKTFAPFGVGVSSPKSSFDSCGGSCSPSPSCPGGACPYQG